MSALVAPLLAASTVTFTLTASTVTFALAASVATSLAFTPSATPLTILRLVVCTVWSLTHAAWNALMHALWGNTSLPSDEVAAKRRQRFGLLQPGARRYVSGLTRRPELNGLEAKIVQPGYDNTTGRYARGENRSRGR